MNVAAIDIGSNGARLLLAELREDGSYRTYLRKRSPIRFGAEAFRHGEFRHSTFTEAFALFEDFRQTMEHAGVVHCLCVATSAFRQARNASQLIREVVERFKFTINIIDGDLESELVLRGIYREVDCPTGQCYLLIDVGGGSTEIVLARGAECSRACSVEVGTIRLLQGMGEREQLEVAGHQLLGQLGTRIARDILPHLPETAAPIPIVGTGGNLRRLGKLKKLLLDSDKEKGGGGDSGQLERNQFENIVAQVLQTPYRQRIERWGLRPSRAEVIVPACHIIATCLQQLHWVRMQLPQGGPVDGAMDMLVNSLGRGDHRPLSVSSFFL